MGLLLGYNIQFPASMWILAILLLLSLQSSQGEWNPARAFWICTSCFLVISSIEFLDISLWVSTTLRCDVEKTKRRTKCKGSKCHKTPWVHRYVCLLKRSWYAALSSPYSELMMRSNQISWGRTRAWHIWVTKPIKRERSSVVRELIIHDQLNNSVLRKVFIRTARLKWSEWNAFQNYSLWVRELMPWSSSTTASCSYLLLTEQSFNSQWAGEWVCISQTPLLGGWELECFFQNYCKSDRWSQSWA